MQYGILTYLGSDDGTLRYNVGDYIQSVAARQYLPRVDVLINRERLALYKGPPLKLIMNGWFTHQPDNWVPSPAIIPHFVSFHINSSAADKILSPKGIEYLTRYAPIGCRDHHTVELLRSRGIEAYFTGCLTLTLTQYKSPNPARKESILVDPFFNIPDLHETLMSPKTLARTLMRGEFGRLTSIRGLLREGLSPAILRKLNRLSHYIPSTGVTEEAKFERADATLRRYAEADLVVTSRIHCALPCIAMNTPVVFLNKFDDKRHTCRFDGLLNLFNRIDYFPEKAPKANFGADCPWDGTNIPANPANHTKLAADLRASCSKFIQDI